MTLRSWGQGTWAVWLLAIPVWKLSLSEASRPFAVEIIISCALAQIGIARTVLPTPDRWQGAQILHMLLCSLGRHGHASWLGTCYCNRGCLWSSQRHCPGRAGSYHTGLLQSEQIPGWPMLGANQALGCWEISLSTSLGIFIISLIRGNHNEVQISKVFVSAVGHLAPADSREFSTFTDLQSSKVSDFPSVYCCSRWYLVFRYFPQSELRKCWPEGNWYFRSIMGGCFVPCLACWSSLQSLFSKKQTFCRSQKPSLLHLPVRLEFALWLGSVSSFSALGSLESCNSATRLLNSSAGAAVL